MSERFLHNNPYGERGPEREPTPPNHETVFPEQAQEPAPGEQEPSAAEQAADHETGSRRNPRIYFTAGLPLRAELTDGAWIDMARPSEAIYDELYAVFGEDETYGPEGVYIWDHDGFGVFGVSTGALGLEGTDSIELLAQVARGIAEHGPAFAVWASVHEEDPRLFGHFATAYKGHHENMAAYVRQLFEPLKIEELLRGAAPEGLQGYVRIDYGALGEEMERQNDVVAFPADGGGVWVFEERA